MLTGAAFDQPRSEVAKTTAWMDWNDRSDVLWEIGYRSLWAMSGDGEPRDEIERDLLLAVARAPSELHERLDTQGECIEYRSAWSVIASVDACVRCHNNHPRSPKKDFKVGDVMGGYVFRARLEADLSRCDPSQP